jgi:hypothetical protein
MRKMSYLWRSETMKYGRTIINEKVIFLDYIMRKLHIYIDKWDRINTKKINFATWQKRNILRSYTSLQIYMAYKKLK